MGIDRHWVISTFNQDPSEIVSNIDGSFEIYNQGEKNFIPKHLRKVGIYKRSLHSGHNLSDYLHFIIENYANLPKEVGLAKGNLFPRHTSKDIFLKRIKRKGFVSLYSDNKTFQAKYKTFLKFYFIAQQISPGLYLEINNDWYKKTRPPGRYYNKLDDLFIKLFQRPAPKYNLFVPGGCMVVPAENIVRWPLDLFKNLYEATTYIYFPVEAFHLERTMFYLFGAEKE